MNAQATAITDYEKSVFTATLQNGQTVSRDASRVELNTLPGKGHAVFTRDFVDQAGHPTRQALGEILSYFHLQLDSPA